MKKHILIVVAILMALSMIGCGKTTDNTKPEVQTDKFSEAEDYPEVTWPGFGISEKLPVPDWSNHGSIDWDTESFFSADVGYSTKADFDHYVNECRDSGFTVDYFSGDTVVGYVYSAKDEDGYSIQICYRVKNVISIQITAPDAE